MGRNESIDIWQKESVDRLYDAPSCDNSVYIIIRKGIRLTTLVSVISVSSAFSAEWPSLDRIDERDYSSQTHIQKEYSLGCGLSLQVIPSYEEGVFLVSSGMEETMADRNYRLQSLCRSLKHYGGDDVEPDVRVLVDDFLDKLADVAFTDDIVEYDAEGGSITARLKLGNDFEVSVTRFADEAEVLYSLFHGRKLLICDEMPIEGLVESLNEVVSKLSRV